LIRNKHEQSNKLISSMDDKPMTRCYFCGMNAVSNVISNKKLSTYFIIEINFSGNKLYDLS
jgi:hypothetical protein